MNRIDARFAQLKKTGRAGLIPFVTAGDPAPLHMVALMHALVAAGADLIELGIPFSDPMADGLVIQQASERAISAGVGLSQVLRWVDMFRQRDAETPVVLMGYLNPIVVHGCENFATKAVSAGVDGVLMVDCPWEQSAIMAPVRAAGLRQILLAAPTTSPERLLELVTAAEGFLYYVSFSGITGDARLRTSTIVDRVSRIRKQTNAPVAVGFGVRDATTAGAIAGFADAVVVGSALVECLAGAHTVDIIRERVAHFLAPIRGALDAR